MRSAALRIIRGMRVFRGLRHPGLLRPCALTIGNFDGVHRGHQAMLALLNNEAQHRNVPSAVLTWRNGPVVRVKWPFSAWAARSLVQSILAGSSVLLGRYMRQPPTPLPCTL